MTSRNLFGRLGVLVFVLLGAAACGDPAEPLALEPQSPSFASTGPVLVECPTESSRAATGMIGATGGSVRLEQHELSLPVLAVRHPREFRVRTPVSNYMELEVGAADQDSFQFGKPGTITIDYSRCTRSNIDRSALSVWQIDPDTKELLEYMGGVDDKEARTVTFETDHLSTFSIAH